PYSSKRKRIAMQASRIVVGLAILCLVGCSRSSKAVDQDLSGIDVAAALAAAENQAREMGEAFVAGDLDTLLDRTHARVLELGGGREKVRKTIQDGLDGMKAKGQLFHSMTVGKPDKLVLSKTTLYTIVPEYIVM